MVTFPLSKDAGTETHAIILLTYVQVSSRRHSTPTNMLPVAQHLLTEESWTKAVSRHGPALVIDDYM